MEENDNREGKGDKAEEMVGVVENDIEGKDE